jgi:hypothetical protein
MQKVKMLFVGLLAGIKAVSHTATTVRVDPALLRAFGLPGCADQSVIAETLDATTEADVAALRAALAESFERYSQARQHNAEAGFSGIGCGSVALARQYEGRRRAPAAIWAVRAPRPGASWCASV